MSAFPDDSGTSSRNGLLTVRPPFLPMNFSHPLVRCLNSDYQVKTLCELRQPLTVTHLNPSRSVHEISPQESEPEPDFMASAGCWGDVRDVAMAHVKALSSPKAGGERFIACTGESVALLSEGSAR